MGNGRKYATMNCMKYLMSQTLLTISKLKTSMDRALGVYEQL
jgi:hypothetical protein